MNDIRSLARIVCASTIVSLLAGCVGPPPTLATIFLRPTTEMVGTPADYRVAYDELFVPVNAERQVAVWHARAEDPKGIVVIVPGSDRNKSRYLIALPVFVPNGYDVVLMDYSGFGDSTPTRLELDNLSEDGLAVVDYARSVHENVFVFGISTGGPTAVWVGKQRDVTGVMLEAPLVLEHEVEYWLRNNDVLLPLWDIANLWVYPQLPPSFDILDNITDVDEPLLVMQSIEDEVVPYETGVMVYDAANEPRRFFEMRGGHGKMIELEPELYTATITGWLDALAGEDEATARQSDAATAGEADA